MQSGVTEGRIVHYVAYNNRHLASIIIGVVDAATDSVNIAMFTDMVNVNGQPNFGLQFQQGIKFSATKEPGTWHWVEQA